jgi:serine/threonine-protein kinase HipA
MNGLRVGTWRIPARGPMELLYDPAWIDSVEGRPISLSLPFLGGAPHRGNAVAAYFDNLLPDTPELRKRLQRHFKTASDKIFDLLSAVGRDCVGALQLLPPDEAPGNVKKIDAEPLSKRDIEKLLLQTASAAPAWNPDRNELRISIAGAQEKTALLLHQGKWHRPLGMTPTTHLFKLPLGLVDGRIDMSSSVENEWLCAQIIAAYGLPVADCEVAQFESQKALVVKRFDRMLDSSKRYWLRMPQEDFCQATATPVEFKYESNGGPGILAIMEILRQSESPLRDPDVFLYAQLLFWMLAAPDGHAKNFSLHILPRGAYRLTPLYDVISLWPAIAAKQDSEHKLTLAMGLPGGKNKHYDMKTIQRRHFNETARKAGYGMDMEDLIGDVLDRTGQVITNVEARLPPNFPAQVAESIFSGLRKRARTLAAKPSK